MKSRLSLLTQGNEKLEEKLSHRDAETLKRIMSYFSQCPLSAIDAQVLRKDLAGMAHEAEQRGESLEASIGDDLEAFCESVLENMSKDNAGYFLRRVSYWLWAILAAYLIDWGIFNSFSRMYSFKIWLLVYIGVAFAWHPLYYRYFATRIRGDVFKRTNEWAAKHMTVYIIFVVILLGAIRLLLPAAYLQKDIISIACWIPIAIFAPAAAASQITYWLYRGARADIDDKYSAI